MSVTVETAISRIQDFYTKNKRIPSYKELAKMFGFASKNASFKLVKKLIELDVLEKDKTGKIIPKNLFKIPHPELAAGLVTTNDLKKVVEDLLKATKALAEAHPLPKNKDKFLRIIEATYRRNTFTLLGISYLSEKSFLADSAMDLVRKMIEDTISIEYMILKGKEEMAERFSKFIWMQFHQNMEFLKTTGANFADLGLAEKPQEIEKKYQEVKAEFTHKPTNTDLRSWVGKDVESMLEELKEAKALNDFDISRTAIGYVRACWKNHFNPYDVGAYLTSDLLEASAQEAMNHALIFGATCLFRLTTRYIDHVRGVAGANLFKEDFKKADEVWQRLNP